MLRILFFQILCGFPYTRCHLQQVESADHTADALLTAYLLGIVDNIADTGMTASGDDPQPLLAAIGKRRIVQQIVRLPACSVKPFTDRLFSLKVRYAGNLAQEGQSFTQLHRLTG